VKNNSLLKNTTPYILLAGLALGMSGVVHAQTSGAGQAGGAKSGQGGSTSGEAITGQRNSQGDGTTDTTGKGTSGKDDSYSASPRRQESGSTGKGPGSSKGSGSSDGSGSSQGGGSGTSSGSGGY
jgi:hypothetical protein